MDLAEKEVLYQDLIGKFRRTSKGELVYVYAVQDGIAYVTFTNYPSWRSKIACRELKEV